MCKKCLNCPYKDNCDTTLCCSGCIGYEPFDEEKEKNIALKRMLGGQNNEQSNFNW